MKERLREQRMIVAGYGGQGILFLGKMLAEAAMREGKHTTFLPAYGAEVRGGTANCMVVVSPEEIGSPYVEEADVLVAMNLPSWERFAGRTQRGAQVFVNSSLIKRQARMPGREVRAFAFTDIALGLGSSRCANMVALGCLAACLPHIVSLRTLIDLVEAFGGRSAAQVAAMNRQALLAGSGLISTGRT